MMSTGSLHSTLVHRLIGSTVYGGMGQITIEQSHAKTGFNIFVFVIPKEGLADTSPVKSLFCYMAPNKEFYCLHRPYYIVSTISREPIQAYIWYDTEH